MEAEGWYVDPFGAHEHRWFSRGAPTALVRDGGREAEDSPPVARYEGELVEAAAPPPPAGVDLLRADQPGADPADVDASPSAPAGGSLWAAGTD